MAYSLRNPTLEVGADNVLWLALPCCRLEHAADMSVVWRQCSR